MVAAVLRHGVQQIACRAQHLHCGPGVLALEMAVEGIHEEHRHLLTRCCRRQRLIAAREGVQPGRAPERV